MEDINKIADAFGLRHDLIYKVRYYYIVKSGGAEYRIVPTALTEERLNELYSIKEELFAKGLNVCDRFIKTPEGALTVKGEESGYIVIEGVRGHPVEFENTGDIPAVYRALGNMHSVLKKIECKRVNLVEDYVKGCNRLKSIKKQLNCSKKLNDTDIDFIKNYRTYFDLAENATKTLEGLSFGVTGPIHGALKEDNILVGRNVFFMDWELCRSGHFMEDVAQLTSRYMRKYACCHKDYFTLDELLSCYTEGNPVDNRELAIFYALLMYPKRYISICAKHYGKAHRFTPVGIQKKFEECYENRDFFLHYIGVE